MRAETHRIPVTGSESIVLDWIPPSAGEDTAVFLHGLGSHRRGEKALHFAERFAARGWGFMALDLRGHGESDGTMMGLSLSRSLADLAAALAWLPTPAKPRLLIGSSMGGAIIAWHRLLHPDPHGAVVLIAPSLAFPHRWLTELPPAELEAWRRQGVRTFRSEWIELQIGWGIMEDAKAYDFQRLVRDYAAPTLILHGMDDTAVDWHGSVSFAETCPYADITLVLIKAGDHRLTMQKTFLFDAMWAWQLERSASRA
jgi:alpha-beta hydrolase superfamily lysophospholipase